MRLSQLREMIEAANPDSAVAVTWDPFAPHALSTLVQNATVGLMNSGLNTMAATLREATEGLTDPEEIISACLKIVDVEINDDPMILPGRGIGAPDVAQASTNREAIIKDLASLKKGGKISFIAGEHVVDATVVASHGGNVRMDAHINGNAKGSPLILSFEHLIQSSVVVLENEAPKSNANTNETKKFLSTHRLPRRGGVVVK